MPLANYSDLKTMSVLITGGGSGIGAALTKGFLEQGSKVAILEIDDASDFYSELESIYHENIQYIRCDVTNIAAVQQAVEVVSEKNGIINVLINNAANDDRHTLQSVTESYWRRLIDINLTSYYFLIQAVAKGMVKIGGGSIINMTSISYMMGNTGYPIYSAANSGINGMTRSLARELGPSGIRVNAIAPGWVMTPKQVETWLTPEQLEEHLGRQCLKQPLQPEDIVGPALFLASSASKMITGQAIIVDAGVVTSG